jgi:hypothetical protein
MSHDSFNDRIIAEFRANDGEVAVRGARANVVHIFYT